MSKEKRVVREYSMKEIVTEKIPSSTTVQNENTQAKPVPKPYKPTTEMQNGLNSKLEKKNSKI